MKNDFPEIPSTSDPEMPVGLRRGGILAAGSIAASALTTLCSLAATVVILRVLRREEAGRFALLVELLYSVGLLGTLGQSILQARLYLQHRPGHFDWLRDTRSTLWMTAPVVVVAVAAMAIPYGLTGFQSVVLATGAELFILTSCFSAILGQQRHYVWSSALLRLGNGFLIVPAILMWIAPSLRRLDFVLTCLLAFLAGVTLLGGILVGQRLERGRARITFKQRLTGLIFLASLLALVVPQRGMIVVAGAMLSSATVAALAAVVSILRVFDLVGESSGRVFSTEMARTSRRIGPALFAAPWLLAGLMIAGALLGLPAVVHGFYGGRYDATLPFLPWLAAAAALRLVEMVPRGYLVYVAPARLFNRFAAAQCAAAIVGTIAMVTATAQLGIKGLVWTATAIAAVRLVISYLFLVPVRAANPTLPTPDNGLAVEPLEVRSQKPPV